MNDRHDDPLSDEDADELRMLLAGEAIGDLDADERSRLNHYRMTAAEDDTNSDSLQRIAESIGLASELTRGNLLLTGKDADVSLKPELVDRIRRDASMYLPGPASLPGPAVEGPVRSSRSLASSGWIGWVVAASLAVACVAIYATTSNRENVAVIASVQDETAAAAWLSEHPAAVQLDWTIKDESLVVANESERKRGSVAWDSASQTGFMNLTALPVNDPAVEQYQLWIIDPKRDDEPVDGGVFDIVQAGDSYVPIQAKLNVIDPVGFAITVEKPGGVVVSDQSRLPLLALVQLAQN